MRRLILVLAILPLAGHISAQEQGAYRSPYRVEFSRPIEELIGDLERTERGDRRLEASIAHEYWYTRHTLDHYGAWGPHARDYPPPVGIEGWSAERKRERVIATAMRFVGYGYQHHHIPDWDPPRDWPWKKTCVGKNGRGVDCSNFVSFVYNLGFGIRISSDVVRLAEERLAEGPGRMRTPARRIELPEDYEDRLKKLKTGDLLFIRNRSGHISHVVFWIGPVGKSPDGVPLVLDSHGEDVKDSNGVPIPCGIHLRPFRKNSWYNMSASHATRLIEGE